LEIRPSLAVITLGGGPDSAQGTAVAKLIQHIDNLPVTKRQALQASPRFTYQMAQFGNPDLPFHGSRGPALG
jgi:hypothetical protein